MNAVIASALFAAASLAIAPVLAHAGVVVIDHSFGHTTALAGPNFVVPQSAGSTRGGNLFQSLKTLRIAAGESVTFSGSTTIRNVLTRITGGSPASINGTLRCTIPHATFYLISPAGVVFGPSATLDVGGSFLVSTAQQLTFGDGQNFSTTNFSGATLTSASPAAFGFLSPSPSAVTLNGCTLAVPTRSSITVAAGNVRLNGGATLRAPIGSIDVLALASATTARIVPNDAPAVAAGAKRGTISLSQNSAIATSGLGGGRIVLDGGDLSLDHSGIEANTTGTGSGRGISIRLSGELFDVGGAVRSETFAAGNAGPIDIRAAAVAASAGVFDDQIGISTQSSFRATGNAGNISVHAQSLQLSSGQSIATAAYGTGNSGRVDLVAEEATMTGDTSINGEQTGITTAAYGTGRGGAVRIHAGKLSISNNAGTDSSTYDSGVGGSQSVTANVLTITGGGQGTTGINSFCKSFSSGPAGPIAVHAGSISITHGATIASSTYATGRAGDVTVTADHLHVDGDNGTGLTGIGSQCEAGSSGAAGNVAVHAAAIQLDSAAAITSSTFAVGHAGDVHVRSKTLTIDGRQSTFGTGIFSTSEHQATGAGGSVVVQSDRISIFGGGGITSSAFAAGKAGDVSVFVDDLKIDGSGDPGLTGISSLSNPGSTAAGGSTVVTAKSISLVAGGEISSSTFSKGDAGTVEVTADQLSIDGRGNSSTTGVLSDASSSSTGKGGPVSIHAGQVQLLAGGQIASDAFASGNAGDVHLIADGLTIDGRGNSQAAQVASEAKAGSTGAAGSVYVHVNSASIIAGGNVSSSTSGSGSAGGVQFVADQLKLDGRGSPLGTYVASDASDGSGNAGSVRIHAHRISILNSAGISSDTYTGGRGGDVSVTTDALRIAGGDDAGDNSFLSTDCLDTGSGPAGALSLRAGTIFVGQDGEIESATTGSGAGGSVSVRTNVADIVNGGLIDSDTTGDADAGQVKVQVNRLILNGFNFANGTGISSDSDGPGVGRAGRVEVDAVSTSITQGASISSAAYSLGSAGNILFKGDRLIIDGQNQTLPTGISSGTGSLSAGNGGSVNVHVRSASILAGGFIGASTSGTGQGGNVQVSAQDLLLDARHQPPTFGTGIASQSQSVHSGDAGDLQIDVTRKLTIDHGAQISTGALAAGGGNEVISARQLMLRNGSISTAAAGAGGNIRIDASSRLAIYPAGQISAASGGTRRGDNGGNITIGRTAFAFLPGVGSNAISANANQGNGGNITIEPGLFLRPPGTPNNAINASSVGGIAGTISIQSPQVDLTSEITPLNASLDAAGITLAPTCGTLLGAGQSSFTLEGGNGLPVTPEDPAEQP